MRNYSQTYFHQPIYGKIKMPKVKKKIHYQMIILSIQKIFVLSYQTCGMKERNTSIFIMLWLVGCYTWFLTLGGNVFKLLSRVWLLDRLKKSFMKLFICFGANIQNSTIRMIILKLMYLYGTVHILLMVIVICGIRNIL